MLELARAKAAAIQHKLGGIQSKSLLVTCDQVVVHQGHVLEKPTSPEEVAGSVCSFLGTLRVHTLDEVRWPSYPAGLAVPHGSDLSRSTRRAFRCVHASSFMFCAFMCIGDSHDLL